jgi:hypothetical protein
MPSSLAWRAARSPTKAGSLHLLGQVGELLGGIPGRQLARTREPLFEQLRHAIQLVVLAREVLQGLVRAGTGVGADSALLVTVHDVDRAVVRHPPEPSRLRVVSRRLDRRAGCRQLRGQRGRAGCCGPGGRRALVRHRRLCLGRHLGRRLGLRWVASVSSDTGASVWGGISVAVSVSVGVSTPAPLSGEAARSPSRSPWASRPTPPSPAAARMARQASPRWASRPTETSRRSSRRAAPLPARGGSRCSRQTFFSVTAIRRMLRGRAGGPSTPPPTTPAATTWSMISMPDVTLPKIV